MAEEQEHARLLAQLVERFGGKLVTEHWTDRCFRMIRHALGVGFEIQVLLTAEIIGTTYYRLLRGTGDRVLRQTPPPGPTTAPRCGLSALTAGCS